MRAVIQVNAGLVSPVPRIVWRQALHSSHRIFVGHNHWIICCQVGNVASRGTVGNLLLTALTASHPHGKTQRTEYAGTFQEFSPRKRIVETHTASMMTYFWGSRRNLEVIASVPR